MQVKINSLNREIEKKGLRKIYSRLIYPPAERQKTKR